MENIKNCPKEELHDKLDKAYKTLLSLRVNANNVSHPHLITQTRRWIAKLKTRLKEIS